MSKRIPSNHLECLGAGADRKARKLPKGVPNVCYKIRSGQSDPWGKRHVAEIFSGKTGQSLGFIGPVCSIVPTPAQAESSNYLNKMNTEELLVGCLGVGWRGIDHAKGFKKEVKEALKRQPKIKAKLKAKAKAKAKK